MNSPTADTRSMALFCDFENVALGVREAKYEQFDITRVLERLLLKGSIVVKKAYCDWDRYKDFKAGMHQASFELIEIPHVRMSGKNSADIRMVVDALDLCYTKAHVDTFVIISGDSDFSPLVSKLRENNKTVIGVGVKNSTSDLLIANCDEFIFYDDLVREQKRDSQAARRRGGARKARPGEKPATDKAAPEKAIADRPAEKAGADKAATDKAATDKALERGAEREPAKPASDAPRLLDRPAERAERKSATAAATAERNGERSTGDKAPDKGSERGGDRPADKGGDRGAAQERLFDPSDAGADSPEEREERTQEALDLVVTTVDALLAERDGDEKIWGSMVKQTLKRRKPQFSEGYYGFRSFNRLLEDACERGLLMLEYDDKSGGYIVRGLGPEAL